MRVGATFETATDDMFVTAYEHAGKKTNTIVIINAGAARAITLQGGALPTEYKMYRTSMSNSENCSLIGTVKSGSGNRFALPENSIVTLQAGGDAL